MILLQKGGLDNDRVEISTFNNNLQMYGSTCFFKK